MEQSGVIGRCRVKAYPTQERIQQFFIRGVGVQTLVQKGDIELLGGKLILPHTPHTPSHQSLRRQR